MNVVRRPIAPLAGLLATLVSALVGLAIERQLRVVQPIVIGLCVGVALAAAEAWEAGRPRRSFAYPPRPPGAGPFRRPGPFTPALLPPPPHQQLVRVVPIAQTQTQAQGGATIMLLALEDYTDGFLVHSRVLLAAERPPEFTTGPTPHPRVTHLRPALEVRDDRGTAYRVWPASGGGGGREYRFTHHGTPPLPPEARTLTITLPALRWEEFDSRGRASEVERIGGPWTFTVPLRPAGM
jgi:hypothetical protein